MSRRVDAIFNVVTLLVDACMAWLAFFLSYTTYSHFRVAPPFRAYLVMAFIAAGATVAVFFFSRLYHRPRGLSHFDEITRIIGAVSISVVTTVAFTTLLFPTLDYSRWIIVLAWLYSILLISLGRLLLSGIQTFLRERGVDTMRILIVGGGETGKLVSDRVHDTPNLGYKIVGCVDDRPNRYGWKDVPLLGGTDDLEQIIEKERVDEVIIAMSDATHAQMLDLIGRCHRGNVSIKVLPDVFQIIASEVTIGHLDGLPLLTVRDVALRGWKLTLKRGVDVALSVATLVLLSPILMLVAVLIKLDSPGPVFYTQERMGLDARSFPVIKFRTMRHAPEADQPGWTVANDPRRTRLGRILRRASLDELPQFINVLLGDMSVVGPRPEQPAFVEQFRRQIPRYMERHREKAGLTGWAQVNGLRGDTSIAERTKYDIYYIENWSLWLDFKIMLKTIPLLFRDPRAY